MTNQSISATPAGLAKEIKPGFTEIQFRGKAISAPSVTIENRTVVARGKWLKVASVHDEKSVEGRVVEDPQQFIERLAKSELKADIFTFPQRMTEPEPMYPYAFEWDNAAALPITTYEDWLGKKIGTDVKQNVKKAAKRGVVTRTVPFDDAFVRGIVEIYNESPTRQGRPFWHYGKGFEAVKNETAHCLERSEFIGAYFQDELIGFVKLLYVGQTADLVLIVSKQNHFDKKPTNALIAKAVEVCASKGIAYLLYAKFAYGNKANSSLADFKKRNGFEQIRFPRYYIPLTWKGRVAARLKLYRDIKEILPEQVIKAGVNLRSMLNKRARGTGKAEAATN